MRQQSRQSSKTFCFLILRAAVLISAFASGVCAQCVLTPSTVTVPAGSDVTITASGAPGGEAFFFISAGPNLAESSGQTSLSAWTYTTNHGIGTDTVTASGTFQGQTFTCAPAFVTWTPASCSLAPGEATASLSSSHTVVASVLNGAGEPIANTKISFFVNSGPNLGRNSGLFPPTTDAAGKVSFTYNPFLPPRSGTDTIVASGSIAFNTVSFSCSATVTWVPFRCDEGSEVAVTLPQVMHSPLLFSKPWRVSYGSLPLTFAVTKPFGTLCEARSNLGALPLAVGVPNGPQLPLATGETTATLSVFGPGVVLAKPPCTFWPDLPGQWRDDCILDGREFDPQATYLRWQSPGFKINPLPYVPNVLPAEFRKIPAMTFWVNLTQRGLNHSDMKTVIERIEPEIHRDLIRKLPEISRWTGIQDPGAVRLLVIDPSGLTTGTLPDGRRTNDIVNSFIFDDTTNPGAFFLGTLEGSYMVILTGLKSGDFALAASNIGGDNAASQQVLAGLMTKRDRQAYRVSTTVVSGTPMQFITRASLLDGDLNGDERLDCADVAVVKNALGKRLREVGYNAWADLNADGIVDSRDVTAITKRLPRRVTCS